MSDIFLSDENINNQDLDSKIIYYNNQLFKYYRLMRLYKKQICIYNELIIQLKIETNKLKIVLENYQKKIDNIDKFICKVCFEEYCNCVIMPCMHFVSCENCISKLNDNVCPMCRSPFLEYVKVFI